MGAKDRRGRVRGRYTPVRSRPSPWGAIALVLLAGVALIRNGAEEAGGPPQPAAESAAVGRTVPGAAGPAAVTPLPASTPARVKVPTIRVDAPLMEVGLDAEGGIASPPAADKNLAGWFKDAVTPGEQGTAVVVGHVDNASGPAVFYSLGALKKGHRVEAVRQDGRTAVFEIYGIEVFEKRNFPAERVYGDTGQPELRVITCGGGYSKGQGYNGNVVVFAKLVEVR
ncbi:class F sortase [Streptomyces sp. NPDC002055]|uniref:class F sortase n=1 Tax=Streptomyces sp. NPDC002055 TaxID=3154534 RepID=UPI003316BB9D